MIPVCPTSQWLHSIGFRGVGEWSWCEARFAGAGELWVANLGNPDAGLCIPSSALHLLFAGLSVTKRTLKLSAALKHQ